jgi:hypothetical protein
LVNTTKIEHLTEALATLSFTIGRLSNLMNELERLERQYTVTKSINDNKEMWVSVEISQLDKHRKFIVEFQIEYGYPMKTVKRKFTNLFGNATDQMISASISKVPRGTYLTVRSNFSWKDSIGCTEHVQLCVICD